MAEDGGDEECLYDEKKNPLSLNNFSAIQSMKQKMDLPGLNINSLKRITTESFLDMTDGLDVKTEEDQHSTTKHKHIVDNNMILLKTVENNSGYYKKSITSPLNSENLSLNNNKESVILAKKNHHSINHHNQDLLKRKSSSNHGSPIKRIKSEEPHDVLNQKTKHHPRKGIFNL